VLWNYLSHHHDRFIVSSPFPPLGSRQVGLENALFLSHESVAKILETYLLTLLEIHYYQYRVRYSLLVVLDEPIVPPVPSLPLRAF
jgi:hypothetical protein